MRLYDKLMSPRFENAVTAAIALNVLVLATTHWVAPDGWSDGERAAATAVDVINTIFSVLWLVEALLKMYGFGARCYFSFNWNRFDFFLVLCGISEVVINGATIATGTYSVEWVVELTMVLRLIRVARLIRVVKNVGSLRLLLNSLFKSLPSLMSVGSLLLLLLFIYTVLGVQLFYNVRFNDFVNEDANFTRFGVAMITLFRCATGESWNGIMHDLQVRPHGKDWLSELTGSAPKPTLCADDGSDCGSFGAVPFFFSFTVLSFFLLLNAVIAVLLEHFSENPDDNPIHPQRFTDFAEEWSKLDPHANHRISATQLPVLLRRAPPPLGVGTEKFSTHSLLVVLRALDDGPARLPVRREGTLVFHELLMSLTRRSVSMPPDGLGASRFAMLHRERVRSAMCPMLKSV